MDESYKTPQMPGSNSDERKKSQRKPGYVIIGGEEHGFDPPTETEQAALMDQETAGVKDPEEEDEWESVENDLNVYVDDFKSESQNPENLSNAWDILETAFAEYDASDEDANWSLYAAAYSLEGIFFPSAQPENTGSLDQRILYLLRPLLHELEDKHPKAVSHFCGVFTQVGAKWVPTDQKFEFDPYLQFEDAEQVRRHYIELIESDCDSVMQFALHAISSTTNSTTGIEIASAVLKRKSWRYLIESALARDGDRQFGALMECIQKIANPKNSSLEEISQALAYTKNDLEWVRVESYLSQRQKVEKVEYGNPNFCIQVLREVDVPFYNEQKSREAALRIIENNHQAYQKLLQSLEYGICSMWSEYEGGPIPPNAQAQIDEYARLSPAELLNVIDPVYSFNLVLEWYPDSHEMDDSPSLAEKYSEIEKSVALQELILSDEDLRERVAESVQEDVRAYQMVFFETDYHEKFRDAATRQSSVYNLPAILDIQARLEGNTGGRVWGYVANCSALSLGKDIKVLYSPTGRQIDFVKISEKKERVEGEFVTDIYAMAHILEDDDSFTPSEKVTALCMLWWNRLPVELQSHLTESYLSGPDINIKDYVLNNGESFEVAVGLTTDLAPHMPEGVTKEVYRFVGEQLALLDQQLELPHVVTDYELPFLVYPDSLPLMQSKHDLGELKSNFSFESVKFMAESMGVNFSDISSREFFALVRFLQGKKQGEGFKKLRDFSEKAVTDEGRLQRVRTFLVLEQGDETLGDHLVAFGSTYPEVAEKTFALYSELLDAANRAEEIVRTEAICDEEKCAALASDIRGNIIGRAQSFLENAVRTGDIDGLTKQLEILTSDAMVFASAFRTVKTRTETFNFEELRNVEFASTTPETFSETDKSQMQEILRRNWGGETEEFLGVITDALNTALENSSTTFHVLRYKGRIVGFDRFDDKTTDENFHLYMGSFNVDPEFGNGKLGEAVFEGSLQKELEKGIPVEADCDPFSPITKKYIESGFVATTFYMYGGKPSFHIVHDDTIFQSMESRNLTSADIVEYIAGKKTTPASMVVREVVPNDTFQELSEGRVLSRYFNVNGKSYGVFEFERQPV